jgi:hypothetical protein
MLRSNIAARLDFYGGTGGKARRLLILLWNRTGSDMAEASNVNAMKRDQPSG